eukprot:11279547-Alexandrium_andersonii.AAC.1
MLRATAQLRSLGHPNYKKQKSTIDFLGQKVVAEMESLDDEWEFRLSATIKTIGCHTGKLDLLPWEQILVPAGSMSDVPSHCNVPAELFQTVSTAREAALEAFKGCTGTMSQM